MWKALLHFLFDRTPARENMREVAAILRDVISVSNGDGNFDQVLQDVMDRHDPGNSRYRAPRIKQFLIRYERFEDRDASLFIVAQHVLEDLPKIYGFPPEDLIDPDR